MLVIDLQTASNISVFNKQPYLSNKTEHFSYEGGVVDMDVRILSHINELSWTAHKWLLVISTKTESYKHMQ